MIISINGSDYKLPASLAEVSLNDRIQYDRLYGKELREKRNQIIESELDFAEYQCDIACKTISFFGKIPLDVVQNTAIDDILVIYNQVMEEFSAEINFSSEHDLQTEFLWNNEYWVIGPPELKHESKMTFGEFIDAKQSIQNMQDLGEERWGSMLPLACIYLRRKGEKYDKDFVIEGGERMELMKTLPLSIALHVCFFLSSSLDMWLNTFLFSGPAKANQEAGL